MLKNVPKQTIIHKVRRHFVFTKSLFKQKSKFKRYELNHFKLNEIYYGYLGLISCEDTVVYYLELFSVIKQLKKKFPKKMKLVNKVALVHAYTEKSSGIRMGKGKGMIKNYYGIIKRNSIFFELFFFNKLEFWFVHSIFLEIQTKLSFKFFYKYLHY